MDPDNLHDFKVGDEVIVTYNCPFMNIKGIVISIDEDMVQFKPEPTSTNTDGKPLRKGCYTTGIRLFSYKLAKLVKTPTTTKKDYKAIPDFGVF